MKLNFPFALPRNIDEGRTEEEAEKVKKVLEEAYHIFFAQQKYIDDLLRRKREEWGGTYTLDHQLRLVGSSAETWLRKVGDWQEKEKWAMTASAEELEKLKKTNPLVKLALSKSVPAPELATKPASAARRKQVVLEEEDEEEEQQLYVAELDTYVPIDLVEFSLGDPARNEEPVEEQGEAQSLDEYFNMALVLAGEEQAEEEKEAQLLVYRRRNRRRRVEEV